MGKLEGKNKRNETVEYGDVTFGFRDFVKKNQKKKFRFRYEMISPKTNFSAVKGLTRKICRRSLETPC